MTISHRRRHALAIAATLLLFAGSAIADPAETQDNVEAVWKAQRVSFEYHGYSTIYSCRSLRAKLETILTTVGAREGITLRAYDCGDLSGTARFQIELESPVIATEQNVEDVTRYDSKDVLIARARGEQLPTAQDVPRFPAVWKTVSFARSRTMKLTAGDCELVQQVRRQLLPRMSVQITRDNVRCSAAFGNIGPPRLTVSALVPAPIATTAEN